MVIVIRFVRTVMRYGSSFCFSWGWFGHMLGSIDGRYGFTRCLYLMTYCACWKVFSFTVIDIDVFTNLLTTSVNRPVGSVGEVSVTNTDF